MINPGKLLARHACNARNTLPRSVKATGSAGRRWASSSKKNKQKAMRKQMERGSNDSEISPIATLQDMTSAPPQSITSPIVDPAGSTPSSAFSLSQTAGMTPTKLDFTGDLSGYDWQSDKSLLRLDQPDELSFEKEAMFDPSIHLPYAPQDWKGYEPATPLSEFLFQRIGVSGQITTAEYMRHCLTNPNYGYYTNPPTALEKAINDEWDEDHDQAEKDEIVETSASKNDSTIIGPQGDFVTAPEVSHVFGHCICIWLMTQWHMMSKPSGVQLVELGPGRGTLMTDILQLATSSKLSDFGESINSVHLVEASRELRQQQKDALQKALGHLIDFQFSETRLEESNSNNEGNDKTRKPDASKYSITVEWHDDFNSFNFRRDKELPVMMVLQEFIDALPVHVFQMTEDGWRERLIDVASMTDKKPDSEELVPRLRQVLAPNSTPAVDLFLESESYHQLPLDTVVEVCPEGIMLVQDIAKVLEESHGVALIVDYGQEGTGDTLRAFSNHKQVSLTSKPGQVDVTADVDFFALKNCITDGDIQAFGPVTQGEFLMRMGAGDMVIHKIEEESTTEEMAVALSEALKYLVMPEYMGKRYKVLALGEKREGIFAPPGME